MRKEEGNLLQNDFEINSEEQSEEAAEETRIEQVKKYLKADLNLKNSRSRTY